MKQTTMDKNVEKMTTREKKKVSFEEEKMKEIEELKKVMREEVKKVKDEREEVERWRICLQQKEVELSIRADRIEKRLVELENRIEALETKEIERDKALTAGRRGRGGDDNDSSIGEAGEGDTDLAEDSEWSSIGEARAASKASGRSRRSACSGWSLSDAEVIKMKKMMRENERKDRERNIVVKGESVAKENLNGWMKELFNDRLGVEVKIESVWKSGSVLVVKLGSVDDKRKIMMNKGKLVGSRIYIENDLSYEDRKRQEEIARWVKKRKEEGKLVKIGLGKIYVDRRWIRWEDKEAIRQYEKKEGKEGEKEKEESQRKDRIEEGRKEDRRDV